MGLRETKEQLGRIKLYYLRGDTLRSLGCAVLAMKGVLELGAAPSTELRGLIREGMQLLSRDDLIKQALKGQLMYQPGQERQLLAQLASAYKNLLEAQNREDRDVALARKQKLDQALNLGLRLLTQGQSSEADAQFAEAVTHYRDEHTLFRMIGSALVEANEVRRAVPYLKKGLEVLPEDAELLQLVEKVKALRSKGDAA